MPSGEEPRRQWQRYYSLGIELGAAVGGLALLGYWVDRHWGTEPWGVVVGSVVGVVGGMYNFLRAAIKMQREGGGSGAGDDGG